MLFEKFEELPLPKQWKLLKKWKLLKCHQFLSFQELCRRISRLEWNFTTKCTKANILLEGFDTLFKSISIPIIAHSAFGIFLVYNVIDFVENCFTNYKCFFLLCTSKGRVGLKSQLARIPNELFYRVIQLYMTN